MQSTRPSSKSRRGSDALAVSPTIAVDAGELQDSDSSPDILPGEPPEIPGAAAGGKTPNIISTAGEAPPRSVASVPAAAASRGDNGSRGNVPGPVIGGISPQASKDGASPPLSAVPVSTFATVGEYPLAGASDGPPLPLSAPPVSPEPPDAIAEAPEMIWYIRPPSGGQFGPAPGELMRTWMNEGRVSADSLVWREGWRDWREAGAVFPKLRSNQFPDVLEGASVAAATAPAPHANRTKAHRSTDRSQAALLVILGLAVVVLLIVFFYVLYH